VVAGVFGIVYCLLVFFFARRRRLQRSWHKLWRLQTVSLIPL
jgi:heme A synthase